MEELLVEDSFQYIFMDSILLEPDDTRDQEPCSSELHNTDMTLSHKQDLALLVKRGQDLF